MEKLYIAFPSANKNTVLNIVVFMPHDKENLRGMIQICHGTFNKYAGRKDVLYVHARIGGNNWVFCGGQQVAEHPAFIERVDDWCDSTYCDIYLKIDEKIVEKYLKKKEK